MALNEKEKTTIKDLQTQEQTCIKKYKTVSYTHLTLPTT